MEQKRTAKSRLTQVESTDLWQWSGDIDFKVKRLVFSTNDIGTKGYHYAKKRETT